MDYREAEDVLRRHAAAYAGWNYEQFRELLVRELTASVTGPSGAAYACATDVELLDDGGAVVTVSFTVSAAGGSNWFPALVTAVVHLAPGETWDGQVAAVTVQRPGQAGAACVGCLVVLAGLLVGVGWLLSR